MFKKVIALPRFAFKLNIRVGSRGKCQCHVTFVFARLCHVPKREEARFGGSFHNSRESLQLIYNILACSYVAMTIKHSHNVSFKKEPPEESSVVQISLVPKRNLQAKMEVTHEHRAVFQRWR